MSLSAIFDPMVRAYFKNEYGGGEADIESQIKAAEAAIISGNISGTYYNDAEIVLRGGTSYFWGCTNLEALDLPNATGEIATGCFESCISLKHINLPKVTEAKSGIGAGCGATIIDLGSLNMMTLDAFNAMSSLKAVVLRYDGKIRLGWGSSDSFKRTPIAEGTGYVYVPRAYVDYYKVLEADIGSWVNQLRALEDYTVDGTIKGELDLTKMGL